MVYWCLSFAETEFLAWLSPNPNQKPAPPYTRTSARTPMRNRRPSIETNDSIQRPEFPPLTLTAIDPPTWSSGNLRLGRPWNAGFLQHGERTSFQERPWSAAMGLRPNFLIRQGRHQLSSGPTRRMESPPWWPRLEIPALPEHLEPEARLSETSHRESCACQRPGLEYPAAANMVAAHGLHAAGGGPDRSGNECFKSGGRLCLPESGLQCTLPGCQIRLIPPGECGCGRGLPGARLKGHSHRPRPPQPRTLQWWSWRIPRLHSRRHPR